MLRWVQHEADIEKQIKVHGLKGKICLQFGGVEFAMCGENRGRGRYSKSPVHEIGRGLLLPNSAAENSAEGAPGAGSASNVVEDRIA
jgi:hypothetical protein